MKQKVFVAMSGGVDSSVTAALLLKQGYDVEGITMDIGYGSVALEAKAAAAFLGIPHHTVDLSKEFNDIVIADFLVAYQRGETPNPCVICNNHLKFGFLMQHIPANTMFATGHYVRNNAENGRYLLYKAKHLAKDQSYFLYTLSQEVLARCLFPLGDYTKDQIREIARSLNLPAANNADSQDICFIPDGDYRCFMAEQGISALPGDIADKKGQVLGKHTGLTNYTIGQRKGLGDNIGAKAFVIGMDIEANRLIVGGEDDLLSKTTEVDSVNFISFDELTAPMEVQVKIRYKSPPEDAVIYPDKNCRGAHCASGRPMAAPTSCRGDSRIVRVEFVRPVRAVTPGQSAVFYQGEQLIGGGRIKK